MSTRYKRKTSLDDPKPSGKQKVAAVRDEMWTRVDLHLEQIEDLCKHGVNHLADIRREASFARRDRRNPFWGQYGPSQDNVGKHVDALAGVVYGYMQCIEMLDEVLNESSINERRKHSNGKDQGEEGKEAGRGAEGSASVEAKGEGQGSSGVEREIARADEVIKRARKAQSGRSKPAKATPRKRAGVSRTAKRTGRGKASSA